MIIGSAEVRWFFATPLPEIREGFDYLAWGPVEERTDLYLSMAPSEAVGVKIRDNRFEIKARNGDGQATALSAGVIGHIDLWQKWSLNAPTVETLGEAMQRDSNLIEVGKRHWLLKYSLDAGAAHAVVRDERPVEGCGAEVTALRYGERQAWSLGLEAFGTAGRGNLLQAAALFFKQYKLPMPLTLTGSYSYPEWLKTGSND